MFHGMQAYLPELETIHSWSLSLHGCKDIQENLQLHEHARHQSAELCDADNIFLFSIWFCLHLPRLRYTLHEGVMFRHTGIILYTVYCMHAGFLYFLALRTCPALRRGGCVEFNLFVANDSPL